jgi:hypothetical protein
MVLPKAKVVTGAIFVLLAAGAVATFSLAQEAAPKDKVIKLNQGWSDEDRLRYYFTSQGSAVMPYDLFLNLEEAGSAELFRSDKAAETFGLIPEPADPKYNPDGLPIGIAKAVVTDGRWKGEWAGITCAACHNSELKYKGARIRIDGGAPSFDLVGFVRALYEALEATAANPEKFERLAARLHRSDANAKAELKSHLDTAIAELHYYETRTTLTLFPIGPGRIDALSEIHNRLTSVAARIPENWVAGLAPTKPPSLWDAPQSAWVQWSGSVADALNRNATEAIGVFAKLDLVSKTPEEGLFESTLDLKGQIEIEKLLRRLAPPKWPEAVLGPIDQHKAAQGAALFVVNCSECHSVSPHRWSAPLANGKRYIENALVPLDVVGTDPMQFRAPNFDRSPGTITGALSPYLDTPYTGSALATFGEVNKVVTRNMVELTRIRQGLTANDIADARGAATPVSKGPHQPVYKAGPRDGIWAAGPFLHNGSVPNLYELLLPAAERSKAFYLGRDFDPVKVGVDTSGNSGKYLFDTSLVGNSNAGHSFEDGPMTKGVIGRGFSDAERWELIEYLKSIPTEDAQITPYGGPKDPIDAWQDPIFFNNTHQAGYHGQN